MTTFLLTFRTSLTIQKTSTIHGRHIMKTKVFISWSGSLSKRVAESLREWLPNVLQHVKPYFTPDDIEKGSKWDNEISKELEESHIGIICVTRENVDRPWVLFEAGALSKNISKSNVCPIFIDLGSTDTKGPLSRFQATLINEKDFKRLLSTINNVSGESKLDPETLTNVFSKWWPEFEEKTKTILSSENEKDEGPIRPDRELLEEILELTRERILRDPLSIRPNLSVGAIEQLIFILNDIFDTFSGDGPDIFYEDYQSLSYPIKTLCRQAGRDDLYRTFRGKIRRQFDNAFGDSFEHKPVNLMARGTWSKGNVSLPEPPDDQGGRKK